MSLYTNIQFIILSAHVNRHVECIYYDTPANDMILAAILMLLPCVVNGMIITLLSLHVRRARRSSTHSVAKARDKSFE